MTTVELDCGLAGKMPGGTDAKTGASEKLLAGVSETWSTRLVSMSSLSPRLIRLKDSTALLAANRVRNSIEQRPSHFCLFFFSLRLDLRTNSAGKDFSTWKR
jgi:hypothetical protein